MAGTIVFLIIILILLLTIIGVVLYIRHEVRQFLLKYFGTSDLKTALDKTKLESETTPRSVSSIEQFALSNINKDFPDLNINEIKHLVEKNIVDFYNAIEEGSSEKFNSNPFIKSLVDSYIEDKKENKTYDNIKIHRTVVNNYKKSGGIATLVFQSSLEYDTDKHKVQDRINTEFIYIYNVTEIKQSKNEKAFGINCPNCGAPITNLGNKTCDYCSTSIKEIVKKNWILNRIYFK